MNLRKTKVVVSGVEGEVSVSKVDPCGICGKRVTANSVLCVKCGKWIHGRSAKVKRVTSRLGRDFVCGRCKKQADRILPPLLNWNTQHNNVHIWARGPAKPPCRLFNIYAEMYKYQVLYINERTEAPQPDTKTPPKKPRPGQWCNPWGFRACWCLNYKHQ